MTGHQRPLAGAGHALIGLAIEHLVDGGGRSRHQADAERAEQQRIDRHHAGRGQEHAHHGREHDQQHHARLAELVVVPQTRRYAHC